MRRRCAKWTSSAAVIILCGFVSGGAVRAAPVDSLGMTNDEDGVKVVLGPTKGLVFQSESSRLAFHGYAWLRAKADTVVGDETDLEGSVPVARLFLDGDFLDSKLDLFAQTEFAGSSPELLDLFVQWNFEKPFVLRVGQFRTPYSRAYITPLTNLELPTRGLVIDHFGLGRDTGAMVSGLVLSNRFHYDLAVVNGATINNQSGNRDAPSVIGRGEIRFGGGLPYDQAPSLRQTDVSGLVIGFGAAYSRRKVEDTSGSSSEGRTNTSVDVAASRGPLSFRAEGFWRAAHGSPRVANAFGAYGQFGIFVIPKTLELGGRVGWVSDGPDTQSYEAFLAGYLRSGPLVLGHHLKLILAFRYDTADPGGPSRRDRFSEILQAQIFF